ncbi:MAG: hypothetical protein VKJ04_00980 [Vampirovibrionales bacterium]|nr:hypothetical protein [Vampirovibrionales bacterium]
MQNPDMQFKSFQVSTSFSSLTGEVSNRLLLLIKQNRQPIVFFALFVLLSAIFHFCKSYVFALKSYLSIYVVFSITLILSIVGRRIFYRETPEIFSTPLRTVTLIFAILALVNSIGISSPYSGLTELDIILYYTMRGLTFLAGILALFRPSFVLMVFIGYTCLDSFATLFYEVTRPATDWASIWEYATFSCMALFGVIGYNRALTAWASRRDGKWKRYAIDSFSFLEFIAFMMVAVHFSNYFYSFWQKIVLNGGALSWVLENPTYLNFVTSDLRGRWPFNDFGVFKEPVYELFRLTNIPGNLFVFAAQAIVLLAFFRTKFIVWLSVVYDAMHLLIFLAAGILFYKWVALNLAIAYTFKRFDSRRTIPLATKILATLTILIAPLFFTVFKLGWYGTNGFHNIKIEAINKSGQMAEVPPSFWMAHSYVISTGDYAFDMGPSYPYRGGGTLDYKLAKPSWNCSLKPIPPDEKLNRYAFKKAIIHSKANLEHMIRTHHDFALENLSSKGQYNSLHIDHVWYSPSYFRAFNTLDLKQVVAYKVTSYTACVTKEEYPYQVDYKKQGQLLVEL